MPRLEDRDLLLGAAKFVDDIDRPEQLHVSFVRSQVASGRLLSVDLEPARTWGSVVAAVSARDLPPAFLVPLRLAPNPDAMSARQPALAAEFVRYVGEPIAAVVATDRYAAEDAAEQVRVEIEPLTPALDARENARAGAPSVHESVPDNVVALRRVTIGDADRVFDRAEVIIHECLA